MDDLENLSDRLSRGAVTTDPATVAERARDLSPLALLRVARGDSQGAARAVIFPRSTEEVSTVLGWAADTGTPVVPRGAGSGVVGGVAASEGTVILDLSHMDQVMSVDDLSRVVHTQAGIRGDRLEAELEAHGLTLGHYPQSIDISTVGGWIAASSAGQASTGYGAIEDLLIGATVVLAGGEIVRLHPVPRSAAGPDLRRLVVGSEGTLCVVTEAFLACSPRPRGYVWEGFGFESFENCMAAMREVVRAHVQPAIVRGYDEADAALAFGPIVHAGGSVAIIGFSNSGPGLDERRRVSRERLAANGGKDLGGGYGEHWFEHRNDATKLYRQIMGRERLFGPGLVVDTMEVAGLWRDVPKIYREVRARLAEQAQAVGCHLSHLYETGSSLYFTFLIRGIDDRDAEARYGRAWEEAVRACLKAGGTMTHHHGVGRLKVPFLAEELGENGVGVLRRIKQALDPQGLLNPGVLLPTVLEPDGPSWLPGFDERERRRR
ncbi:MAG: FAD-binding oxidoreductase [Actinomycetota bacterium]|nr:FAD-binding oxidoreductase [Actinomycetota bacterium]